VTDATQKGNIKVVLEGRGPLTLRPSNYIAAGGEGTIYVAGDTAIKIYLDPKNKVAWNRVPEKLAFFRNHRHPYVVAPQGAVTGSSGETIGYYMPFIRDADHGGNAEPIARIFTNDSRRRLGFTDGDSSTLVERMREIIMFAHMNNAITVDANELGYFVLPSGAKGPEPRMIDTDCWVLNGLYPPTLPIMPSIRDWHSATPFGEMQDWFAWAVVTFQVYSGLHPYKGNLDGYLPKDFELRMKANASVFDPKIRLNRAVRDFSCIPDVLLEWYEATFQKGERSVPPSPFDKRTLARAAQVMRVVTTTATGALIFKKLYAQVGDPVVHIYPCGVVLLKSGVLINLSTMRTIGSVASNDCEVVKAQGGWLTACGGLGRKPTFSFINETSLEQETIAFDFTGYRFMRYENRLFVVTDRGLSELTLHMFNKPILTVGQTWGAMVNATRWFDGVGIQDAFGSTFVITPFGDNACAQVRVPELDGIKPIVAKAGNRFVTVVGIDAQGQMHKVEITLDREYRSYTIWRREVDSPDLNIAILPKGACVTIVEDGRLSVFVPTNGAANNIQDKQIATDMTLANWGDQVVYIQDGAVWSLQMK
jgi:hypothetical protein